MNDILEISNRRYAGSFSSILFHRLLYLSLILIIAACAAPERWVIKNPEMNQWNATKRRYVNLFQPQYGYLEETEFDHIEFRKPHEMGTRKYAIFYDPRGDIDRSKRYDASEYTVSPELDLLHNPTHDVQITWIRISKSNWARWIFAWCRPPPGSNANGTLPRRMPFKQQKIWDAGL